MDELIRKEEKAKAIDALKISAPVMTVTQEEFNDYIQTLNKIMDWLEQTPMRDATPEERKSVDNYIKSISKPTGVKFDEGQEQLDFVQPHNKIPVTLTVGDAISRQAVLDLCERFNGCVPYSVLSSRDMLPSVSTEKTGHWIMPVQDDGMSDPIYYQVRCSECGFDLDPQTWHQELHQYGADKYCPKCGCRMMEKAESE